MSDIAQTPGWRTGLLFLLFAVLSVSCGGSKHALRPRAPRCCRPTQRRGSQGGRVAKTTPASLLHARRLAWCTACSGMRAAGSLHGARTPTAARPPQCAQIALEHGTNWVERRLASRRHGTARSNGLLTMVRAAASHPLRARPCSQARAAGARAGPLVPPLPGQCAAPSPPHTHTCTHTDNLHQAGALDAGPHQPAADLAAGAADAHLVSARCSRPRSMAPGAGARGMWARGAGRAHAAVAHAHGASLGAGRGRRVACGARST